MTPATPDPPPVSPDPWEDVEECIDRMRRGSLPIEAMTAAVDAARAADALRHQQELRQGDAEIEACRREIARLTQEPFRLTQELTAARAALSTAEATIQQQAKELLGERDAFKADVCAFSREQVQEAVNATLAAETERDAAQQENKTAWDAVHVRDQARLEAEDNADRLREALKALYEAFDCEAVAEGCDAKCQTCRAITSARAALSASPRPQEPQP